MQGTFGVGREVFKREVRPLRQHGSGRSQQQLRVLYTEALGRPGVSIPVLDTNGLCLNITQTISKYEWASVFCVRTNHPEGYELGRGRVLSTR